jgi:hypothetical protein
MPLLRIRNHNMVSIAFFLVPLTQAVSHARPRHLLQVLLAEPWSDDTEIQHLFRSIRDKKCCLRPYPNTHGGPFCR